MESFYPDSDDDKSYLDTTIIQNGCFLFSAQSNWVFKEAE